MKDRPQDYEVIARGRHICLVKRGHWEYVQRQNITGIVGIVPVTEDGKLVLVEQYRPPVASRVVELPAGLVGDVPGEESESFETAARRELLEETGYEASNMVRLVEGVISPGLSDEQITFFQATGLKKAGAGGGDGSEDIIVHEVAVAAVLPWLARCRERDVLVDLKVYIAMPLIAGAG